MDGFTYHNIFDTKGIEYIIIISFFLLLIPFWRGLNKVNWSKSSLKEALNTLTSSILKIPFGLFFNKNHSWVYMEKSGVVKIGLDDFMQRAVGEVNFNYYKNINEDIKKGEPIAEVIQDNKKLEIIAPVSGTILNFNDSLKTNPGIFNEDPYELGWLYTIKPTNWIAETKSFYLAENTAEWAKNEISRFKDFLIISSSKLQGNEFAIALQDGGEIKEHVMNEMPDEIWHSFQKEFLNQ